MKFTFWTGRLNVIDDSSRAELNPTLDQQSYCLIIHKQGRCQCERTLITMPKKIQMHRFHGLALQFEPVSWYTYGCLCRAIVAPFGPRCDPRVGQLMHEPEGVHIDYDGYHESVICCHPYTELEAQVWIQHCVTARRASCARDWLRAGARHTPAHDARAAMPCALVCACRRASTARPTADRNQPPPAKGHVEAYLDPLMGFNLSVQGAGYNTGPGPALLLGKGAHARPAGCVGTQQASRGEPGPPRPTTFRCKAKPSLFRTVRCKAKPCLQFGAGRAWSSSPPTARLYARRCAAARACAAP